MTEKPTTYAKEAQKSKLLPITELRETVFDRVLLNITAILFCFVLLFVILQVIIRYITVHMGFSMPWTEEAARYLLILVTFLGSAIAWRKKEHITITTLVDYFPPKVKITLEFVSGVLILFFLGVALQGSYHFTMQMMVAPVGAIKWLRVGHLYGVMTIGLTIIGVYVLRWILVHGKALFQPGATKGRVDP